MKKSIASFLLTGTFVLCASAALAATAYQIDESHSGAINFQNGFTTPLTRLWVRDLGGPVSYPLVVNGMVFVTAGQDPGTTGLFMALNASSGQTIWSKPLATYWSNAVYDANRIFVLDGNGLLQAFAADASGKLLWQKQFGRSNLPPLASAGTLFISDEMGLKALNEVSGAQLWSGGPNSPTAIGGGGLYASMIGEYMRLDPATGKVVWDDLLGGTNNSGWTPVYHDGELYVRDPTRSAVVLNAATGALLNSLGAYWQPPAFYNDPNGARFEYTLFDHKLYAVDVTTGNVVWHFKGDGELSSAPLVINGTVVEGSQSGRLYFVNGETGHQLWWCNVGAPISQQQGSGFPFTGFGAGDAFLAIPATTRLAVYTSKQSTAQPRLKR